MNALFTPVPFIHVVLEIPRGREGSSRLAVSSGGGVGRGRGEEREEERGEGDGREDKHATGVTLWWQID